MKNGPTGTACRTVFLSKSLSHIPACALAVTIHIFCNKCQNALSITSLL